MKVSDLIDRLHLAIERWGDLECMLDLGEDYIYGLEDVFVELEHEEAVHLLLSTYTTAPYLKVVK